MQMIIMTIPHVLTSMPAQLSFPPGTWQSDICLTRFNMARIDLKWSNWSNMVLLGTKLPQHLTLQGGKNFATVVPRHM